MLRALASEPHAGAAVWDELQAAAGASACYDAAIAELHGPLSGAVHATEAGARLLVERLALALQASVLLRAASPLAGVFCQGRLAGRHGLALGTLPPDLPFEAFIERALQP